ncbi:MAG: molybdopterin-dependent oxidoreductase [Pseudonocardiaceae bacterium]
MSSPAVSSRLSAPVAALVSLLAVVAAVGVGHLVGELVSSNASPFPSVGADVVDLTPYRITEFATSTLAPYHKLVLGIGMAVVIGLFGMIAGLLSRRSAIPGLLLIFGLGLAGALAVLFEFDPNSITRDPNTDAFDLLATLAGVIAGWGAFLFLRRLARPDRNAEGDAGKVAAGKATGAAEVPRRGLLVGSAAVAVGAVTAGAGGVFLAGRRDVEASRRAIGPIRPDVPAPGIPAGADFAADGSPTFITPNSEFYRVDTVLLTVPQLRAEDWRLRIHGMVDRELNLDWADLTSRRLVERTVTMTCVSNEIGGQYVSTSNFTGVLLADILAEAGVQKGADQLFTTSVDGWTCGSPTSDVADPGRQAMLAIGMNSEPLPTEHGFPVRMLVPGLYGFVSATKWIVDMELTTFDAKQAYWLERGWGRRAPIKTMSRIDSPGSFGQISPDTPLTGIAWAQTKGIAKVEVRIDQEPWRLAELSTEVNLDTWRMWRLAGRLQPGPHVAQVRATDKTGYTQTEDRAAPIPDGASGWHRVAFTVT